LLRNTSPPLPSLNVFFLPIFSPCVWVLQSRGVHFRAVYHVLLLYLLFTFHFSFLVDSYFFPPICVESTFGPLPTLFVEPRRLEGTPLSQLSPLIVLPPLFPCGGQYPPPSAGLSAHKVLRLAGTWTCMTLPCEVIVFSQFLIAILLTVSHLSPLKMGDFSREGIPAGDGSFIFGRDGKLSPNLLS